jgi:hypothetical protein
MRHLLTGVNRMRLSLTALSRAILPRVFLACLSKFKYLDAAHAGWPYPFSLKG